MTSKVMTHVVVVKIPSGRLKDMNKLSSVIRDIVDTLSGEIVHSVTFKDKPVVFKDKHKKTYTEVYVPANFGSEGIPEALDYMLDGFDYMVCKANPFIGLVQDCDGRIVCTVKAQLPIFESHKTIKELRAIQTAQVSFQLEAIAS